MSDCIIDKYSSRVCEKGTKGCTVKHFCLCSEIGLSHEASTFVIGVRVLSGVPNILL